MPDDAKKDPISEPEALKVLSELAAAFPSVHEIGLWAGGASEVRSWMPYTSGPNTMAEAGLGLCGCCTSFLLPPISKTADAMTSWFAAHGEELVSAIKNLGTLIEHPPTTTESAGNVDLPAGLQPLLAASIDLLKQQHKVCHPHPQTDQSLDQVLAQLEKTIRQTPAANKPSK